MVSMLGQSQDCPNMDTIHKGQLGKSEVTSTLQIFFVEGRSVKLTGLKQSGCAKDRKLAKRCIIQHRSTYRKYISSWAPLSCDLLHTIACYVNGRIQCCH